MTQDQKALELLAAEIKGAGINPVVFEVFQRTNTYECVIRAINAALQSRAGAIAEEKSGWPEIGEDPLKSQDEAYYRKEACEERLREEYYIQQVGVPDQTALVWRIDLGRAVFSELPRLRAIERQWREKRATPNTTMAEAVAEERG